MEDLTKALGIKRVLSTVYYSQMDGQIEQINQEAEVFLQHYVNYQQGNWTDWLLAAEFQYNNRKHVAIGHILFKLNFGRYPWKGNLIIKTELPKLNDFLEELQRSWNKARISIDITKEAMKKQFDKKRRNPQGLKVADNMWLEAKNIHLKQPSKKLDQKRYEPFRISKDIGQGVFQIKLPEE